MKKYILVSVLLATSLCSATPTVADVEGAMAANNVQLVEQLSKEVLAVHLNSARANYYLAQAYYNEGKMGLAHSHLLSAQADDPTLKFTNNPALFEKLLKETTPVVAHSEVASNDGWLYWLFGAIFLVGVIAVVLISKRTKRTTKSEKYSVPTKVHNYNTKERSFISEPRRTTIERETAPTYRPSESYYRDTIPTPTPTVVNNYHNSGGFGGSGFVEGMIVGELLSNHHSSPTYYETPVVVEERRSSSYSDDTSSGNIWDSGSSGSSWDSSSSSSSSSWDSSSSFDSSSSSSSSDW